MRAVIIEDEERSRLVLQNLLATYCPDVEVVATADSVATALEALHTFQPDTMFLDVQINDGSGFDVLDKMKDVKAGVIFTTAFDQYALKAFKFSAIDYLLKPIDIDELKVAVQKALNSKNQVENQYKIQNLLSNLKNPKEDPVLLVSTLEAVEFVRIKDIIRCEAQGAYTLLILRDHKPILVSKIIKDFEFLLLDYGFYRVHQSHLINLKEVQKFVKSENYLLMRDGAQIQLARSRKDDFFTILHKVQL